MVRSYLEVVEVIKVATFCVLLSMLGQGCASVSGETPLADCAETDLSEGEIGLFSSRSCFSSPSTRIRRASKTSVFGPRFFGTASDWCQTNH